MTMTPLITDDPSVNANDYVMAKNAADRLHKHYPGHLWAVSVDPNARTLDVRNLLLSGAWGFRIPLKGVFSATWLDREIMRAGGELLERYRMRRGAINQEAIANLPTNFAGQHVADR